jgi:formyltetrahydrofolate deformylase
VESHQFDSPSSGMFHMPVEFAHAAGSPLDLPSLSWAFEETVYRFDMKWRIGGPAERQRVLIMWRRYPGDFLLALHLGAVGRQHHRDRGHGS